MEKVRIIEMNIKVKQFHGIDIFVRIMEKVRNIEVNIKVKSSMGLIYLFELWRKFEL